MTESRSGLSSSASARATASMTVAGRNAPASSWASVVRRASNSGAGRGVAGLEGGLGMILANVRGRLRVQDFLLVALALAHGDTARRARYERQLLEEGPDELLDEPGLLAALLALRTLMVPSPAQGQEGGEQAGLVERSEEHTSELQSRRDLVCRLLLEKKKKQ